MVDLAKDVTMDIIPGSDYISASYPFLSIARRYDIPYGVVLWVANVGAAGWNTLCPQKVKSIVWLVDNVTVQTRLNLYDDIDVAVRYVERNE